MAEAVAEDPDRGGSISRWVSHLLSWSNRNASVRPPETVRYGSHPEQVADLWTPEGPGPHPVVVSIHGGYFQKQYRRDIHDPLARRLVASGIAVLNIEYRRARTDGSLDRTTDDVMAAISSLRERESRDRPHRLRERVTALGHSAGGYLALWAGSHPDVEHVVALAAASDLVDCVQGGYDGGSVAAWLGATPKEAPALYAQADLLARLPMGTTSWLVHGDADTTVPPHQSTRYAERARQVGDDAEVHLLPGHGHFGVIDPRDDAFAQWHKLLLERVLP